MARVPLASEGRTSAGETFTSFCLPYGPCVEEATGQCPMRNVLPKSTSAIPHRSQCLVVPAVKNALDIRIIGHNRRRLQTADLMASRDAVTTDRDV